MTRLPRWMESFRNRRRSAARGFKKRRPHQRRHRFEQLEERALLATVTWDGGFGNLEWSRALNWDTDTLPGPGDDVVIGDLAGDPTILHVLGTINSLTSAESLSIASLSVADSAGVAGDVVLSQDAIIDGTADWTVGGQLRTGPNGGFVSTTGTTTIQGGIHVDGGKLTVAYGVMNSSGTTVVDDGARFRVRSGAVFNNLAGATFDFQGSVSGGDGIEDGTFNNAGLLRKSAGIGGAGFGADTFVNNTGTIEVLSGTLGIGHLNNTGTVDVQSGTLYLHGGGSTTTAFLMGPGTNLNLRADFNTTATYDFGTLNQVVPGNLLLDTVTLTGSGDWTVGGTLRAERVVGNNDYSRLAVSGTITVEGGVEIDTSPWGLRVTAGQINSQGASVWTSGTFILENGAVFNNLAGATFDIQGDLASTPPNPGTFNNAGILRKTAGSGTAHLGVNLNNTGTVEAQSGTLRFVGPYQQTAGETRLAGGNIISVMPMALQGGALTGAGTVTATVQSAAHTTPGLQIGTIIVQGPYAQAAGGALDIDLGGLVAGSQFDQLDVNGAVTLGGALNVTFVGGFVPTIGNTFLILDNDGTDAITGTFDRLAEGGTLVVDDQRFQISYGGGDGNDVAITSLGPVNEPPVVDDQNFGVAENETAVGTVVASDPDLPDDALTFSITGGADGGLFAIDGATGELSFLSAPDFETPLDADKNNVYELEVTVTDSEGALDTAAVSVSVFNLASISGVVFVDVNENELYDANEPGIDGVVVELLDEFGAPVLDDQGAAIQAVTADGGFYLFEDLDPATYQVHEIQPTGVDDGSELLGSLGGSLPADDTMQLALGDIDATDYVFAELGQQVAAGDTATIGFWQNKHGQELITAGGSGLADWLSEKFANIFGNEFVGASGEDVAAFFKDQLFRQRSSHSIGAAKVDAQFMAVAFATYFTSSDLAGQVAAGYGFHVTETGIGTKIVNVGSHGDAFDVDDGSSLTIMQLLLATDALTDQPDGISGFARLYDTNGDGVIDSQEASLRSLANDVFSAINEDGDV